MSTLARFVLSETGTWSALFAVTYLIIALIASCAPLIHLGVPLDAVAAFAADQTTLFAIVVLPLGFVTALLTVIGRMREDGEIIALRACGISPIRVAAATLPLALVISMAQGYAAHRVIPHAIRRMFDGNDALVRQAIATKVERRVPIYSDDGIILCAIDLDRNRLRGVFALKQTSPTSELMLYAPQARWVADQRGLALEFDQPTALHTAIPTDAPQRTYSVDVERYWSVLLAADDDNSDHEDALPTTELTKRIAEARHGRWPEKYLRALQRSYHERWIWPASVIVFWAFACGVGLSVALAGRMFAVCASVVTVLLVVIVPMIAVKNLRGDLHINPGWLLWPPVLSCGMLGSVLLWRRR